MVMNPVGLVKRVAAWALSTVSGPWPVSSPAGGAMFGRRSSTAGVHVSEESALSLSGVFAAVNLLSSITAALPLPVMRKDGRTRAVADRDPAHRLLNTEANPEMTAFSFRQTRELHRLLWGATYAEIGWAGNGTPRALWPVEPWRVRPVRGEGNQLLYEVDHSRRVHPSDMLCNHLISYDGVAGRCFIDYALQSLGLGIATQDFAAAYFGNGARPGGLIELPSNWNDEKRREFQRGWNEAHQGASRFGRLAVLWGGIKYTGTDGSFHPEQSQLLEQRRFSIEDVARWFNLPPHLLRELSRATFSNIEHQGIDFVTYTLQPPCTAYEQEYNRKLLNPPALYCRHGLGELMRGDHAARAAYNTAMFNVGARSSNEIREEDDYNPVEGGDVYYRPLNMVALDAPEPEPAPPPAGPQPAPAPEGDQPAPQPAEEGPELSPPPVPRAAESMRGLVRSVLDRMARVEATAVRRAASRPDLLGWMDDYYAPGGKFLHLLADALGASADAATGLGLDPFPIQALPLAWCADSHALLLHLTGHVRPVALVAAVEDMLAWWETRRPAAAAAALWHSPPTPPES